ncbi:MAG: hypothetical protein EOP46_18140 [Sphingobacteriaceae bacterium]|nr:MAG: hypothetical protein EOP46_18140 [Sphingobacteriaceae bacterium]
MLVSLFIYLFYRTEKTVVNELLIRLISYNNYSSLKAAVVHIIPLNDMLIYSLPEGLWMFCITLTSKPYYISFNGLRLDGARLPLIFCLALEFLQLIHVTNGRFDYMDIVIFTLFWLLGRYGLAGNTERQPILATPKPATWVCLLSYGIVYLAHVMY